MPSIEARATVPQGSTEIFREGLRGLLMHLQSDGLTSSIGKDDAPVIRELLSKENIPWDEVSSFVNPKLTQEGKDKFLSQGNSDLTSSLRDLSDELLKSKANAVVVPQPVLTPAPTDHQPPQKLDIALRQGPSVLIYGELMKSIHAAATDSSTPKVTIGDILVNPNAAIDSFKARSKMVRSKILVQETLADAARWSAEAAGLDVRSDLSLTQVADLENKLGNLFPQFCNERGIAEVPPEGSAERRKLLIELNARLAAEQVQAGGLVEAVGKAVQIQVELQGEAAQNWVIAKELPAKNEAVALANRAKEEERTENSRHLLASVFSFVTGAFSGAVEGMTSGVESWVKSNPKVAIPLGVGAGAFIIQVVPAATLSPEMLGVYVARSGLVVVVAALGTGIGSGLVARFFESKKQTNVRK